MKKFLAAVLATGFVAAPAFAASITISFANDDGTTQEWTMDQETMMATSGDISVPYTWDADARVLCAEVPDQGEVCATFEATDEEPSIGSESAYTLSNGGSGTATITAMSE